MSVVKIIPVKHRLSAQMRRAGGLTVEQALSRAGAALEGHRAEAMTAIERTVVKLEAAAGAERETTTPDRIYDLSAEILDIAGLFGAQPLCDASWSLCELADRLRSRGEWEWAGVEVHVRALRFLLTAGYETTPVLKAVIDGLWEVTDRVAKA
ncbi:hypothetical protein [Caulobacter sp. 17J65-9]|uniref:hypothetical protein n=1 Tax=Caulobacter sp. 17J65-9 TaxID=2709382 RepID=UPI0013C5B2EE|nr:hypothetical protein [Caulobacter sp. 17J65-9]NEX95030.1 hypothetical protein [Caulobacter sp. 17J65-9]